MRQRKKGILYSRSQRVEWVIENCRKSLPYSKVQKIKFTIGGVWTVLDRISLRNFEVKLEHLLNTDYPWIHVYSRNRATLWNRTIWDEIHTYIWHQNVTTRLFPYIRNLTVMVQLRTATFSRFELTKKLCQLLALSFI